MGHLTFVKIGLQSSQNLQLMQKLLKATQTHTRLTIVGTLAPKFMSFGQNLTKTQN